MITKFDKIVENVFIPADDEDIAQRQVDYIKKRKIEIDQLKSKVNPAATQIFNFIKNMKGGYIYYDLDFYDSEDAGNCAEAYHGITANKNVIGIIETEALSEFINDLNETYGIIWNIEFNFKGKNYDRNVNGISIIGSYHGE